MCLSKLFTQPALCVFSYRKSRFLVVENVCYHAYMEAHAIAICKLYRELAGKIEIYLPAGFGSRKR
jgi:hypothetical protein